MSAAEPASAAEQQAADALSLLDETQKIVEQLTGTKRLFVAAGWSAPQAEQLAGDIFRHALDMQKPARR